MSVFDATPKARQKIGSMDMSQEKLSGLSMDSKDPLIQLLHTVIRFGVKVLSILMTLVILWGIGDVVWIMIQRLSQPPYFILRISDILFLFGAILVVLIAIEIFVNIILYLRTDVIHVKIVMATALMAIARKIIILDMKELRYTDVFAIAAVALAMSVGYWLVHKLPEEPESRFPSKREI